MSENSIAQANATEQDGAVWGCPEPDCGSRIADGPVPHGEASTDELIREHMEGHAFLHSRGDAEKTAIVEEDAAERRELEVEDAAEVTAIPEPTDAQRVAAGLRQLADLLDANPDLPGTRYAFSNVNLFPRTTAMTGAQRVIAALVKEQLTKELATAADLVADAVKRGLGR